MAQFTLYFVIMASIIRSFLLFMLQVDNLTFIFLIKSCKFELSISKVFTVILFMQLIILSVSPAYRFRLEVD